MLPCSRVSHAKRQLQEDFKIRLSLWETKPGGGKHFMPRGKGQAPLLASCTNASHRGGALAPEVEAAGLMLPHSMSPVPPERQGTPSWPFLPLWLGSQSPLQPYSMGNGHFCTSVTGWAQRLQASRHQRGGCQERSLACRHTGIIPALLSQPSKLAPRGYQLLRRLGMVGKAVTFPPTQRTEASGPAVHR